MNTEKLSSADVLGELYLRLRQGPGGWASRLFMPMDSDRHQNEYRWLGMAPVLSEWVGQRGISRLRDAGYIIRNKHFQAAIEIPVSDMRRDKTGQVMRRIADLSGQAMRHPRKLASDLIIAGESTVCYDGQYYFDTDHSEGASGTQDNDLVVDVSDEGVGGSTTAPTPALMSRAILKAVSAIYGFKDDNGEPLNEDAAAFDVHVPVPFSAAAIAAVSSAAFAGGETNPIATYRAGQGVTINVVTNPRLTWTTKFAVFRSDGAADGVVPFIFQTETGVRASAIAEGSEYEFDNDAHKYGVDYWGNAGYGFWQGSCLVTFQS